VGGFKGERVRVFDNAIDAGQLSIVTCVEVKWLIGQCKQDNGRINIDETASIIRISI
jgi:hypothetical protein